MTGSPSSTYAGKLVLFHGPGKALECRSAQWKAPQGAEILVKITHTAICRSDLHTHCGHRSVPTPTVLGHEIMGRVVAFGPSASRMDLRGEPLEPGDRITWSIYAHCGDCFHCHSGWPQKCTDLFKYGHEPVSSDGSDSSGGMASYIQLRPGTSVLKLDPQIPDHHAVTLNCAMATAAAVVRRAALSEEPAPLVVVMGGGYAGLSTAAMCKAQGARAVMVVETQTALHSRCLDFGADAVFQPEEDALKTWVMNQSAGRGADHVMEMAGSSAAAELGLELLATGGGLMLAGTVFPSPSIPVDPERMVRGCQTIAGLHNYAPQDLLAATRFLEEEGRNLPWDALHGGTMCLDQSQEAFDEAQRSPGKRWILTP